MDTSFITAAIISIIAILALVIFVRGIFNIVKEGREQGKTESINSVTVEPRPVVSVVKEPEAIAIAKEPETTATAEPNEPAKRTDWPAIRVQGPSEETEERIAEIQRIVAKHI